jgi:hypothetical protein
MGISPAEVKKMSVWEMAAVTERWIEAHDTGDDRKGKLDEDEKDEIWAWMQAKPGVPLTLKEARAKKNGAGH